MPSFYIPISGLDADSTALNTIANNLSNMNTTGFKEQTTQFSDLFYQSVGTNGSGDTIQQGSGVQVAANSTDFSGGSIASTGVSTDAAINGSGFFVLDNGASQLYTRDGNFQTSPTGLLESSSGQAVMGYSATNGVINTSGGISDISLPTGQVMKPSATTTFGMVQNLDSSSTIGTTVSGNVPVYDSLGKSYDATVTYTNQGNNTWSYNITMPDTLSAAPTTAAANATLAVTPTSPTTTTTATTLKPTSAVAGGNTVYTYNFGAGGTVDAGTSLTVNGTTITVPSGGESVATLAGQINGVLPGAAVPTTVGGSTILTVTVPTADVATSAMNGVVGDLPISTTNYDFGSAAQVAAGTSLTITGQTASGAAGTPIVVTAGANESVAAYKAQVSAALGAGNIVNASVSVTGNQLSIAGAGVAVTGTANQFESASTINYNFGSSNGTTATVNPGTNLTITGFTSSGTPATIAAPTVTSGETLAQYAAALNNSLASAGIGGVSVTSANGTLSISGANVSTSGSVVQDPVGVGTSGTLAFDSSGNLVSPAGNVSGITFDGLSDAAGKLSMTWDLYGSAGTGEISQTSAASTTASTTQNGYSSGQYQSFAINTSGVVTATYSNGQTQNVGQLAIATVSNDQGLQDAGSTEYAATTASGAASVGIAGNGGRGTIEGSSLEASNVNISAEFSDLIVAQRAFEANSKAVTTFDTITQETINMIH
jgi:flagellar hook protein FlgE